ncbi:MAG: undecaprenyl-diphosphate phosphatase [Candidatus Cyclobacteriaceae bacterium M3_2C_046]
MSIVEAILLGLIQGLTEFLPISSSGHIELGKAILQTDFADNLLFSVVVHGATALSTIVVFRKDIYELIKGLFEFKWNEPTIFISKIFLSIIPVGIVGVFFEEQLEQMFVGNMAFVGSMLLVTGLLLTFTYFVGEKNQIVTYGKALIIGIAQTIAIIPGISRSGATIATGLLLGVEKEKATRFSFLMVLIPIIGASLLKFKDYLENPVIAQGISGVTLFSGFVVAFIAGLIACQWMIRIVKRGKLIYFAIYCFIIGSVAIIIAL